MNVIEIPLSILRFQYKVVRFPLELFETNVVQTWGTESPGRLAFERALGSIDRVVGNVLGASDLQQRGEAKVQASDDLAHASRLDAEAEAAETRADDKLKTAREVAARERQAAAETADKAAREAREKAEQQKQQAEAEAKQKAAAEKKKSDSVAASRTTKARSAEKKQRDNITKAEKVSAAPAEAALADAADHQEQAEDKKAEAERIERLFKSEKETN